MVKRKLLIGMLILGLTLFVGACGDDDDDYAPDSAAGRTYRMAVTAATGAYAALAPGTFTTAFQTDGTYVNTPETANVPADQGSYIYTKIGDDSGEVTLTSTTVPGVVYTCVFTFTSEGAGTYAVTAVGGGAEIGGFAGTFQEI